MTTGFQRRGRKGSRRGAQRNDLCVLCENLRVLCVETNRFFNNGETSCRKCAILRHCSTDKPNALKSQSHRSAGLQPALIHRDGSKPVANRRSVAEKIFCHTSSLHCGLTNKLLGTVFFFSLFISPFSLSALEPWQDALAKMPLKNGAMQLTKTNAVEIMLESFQQNDAVKALIFMPGATDEFYFFNRGNATLTNPSPSLLDALTALTNQTLIRATFRPPFVLLHTAEDSLEPIEIIEHQPTAERIRKKKFAPHVNYEDRNWDFILPTLAFRLDTRILPRRGSHDSHHFYRFHFAAHNLDGWEILEALALSGKTQFTVQKKKVLFEGDTRFRARPKVPENFEAIKELTQ